MTTIDLKHMKLGKRHPVRDHRVRALLSITHDMPPAPIVADWTAKLRSAPLGMMGNDRLGDCTCAAVGHAIQVFTGNDGGEKTVGDDVVVKLYEDACRYDPADPSSDQGGVETEVLNYWLKNAVADHKLDAYASVEPGNIESVKDAIAIFGGCYIGVALPVSAQSQDVWTVPPGGPRGAGEPGSWGGHAVYVPAYDERGLTCITWGSFKTMSWEFWRTYCDEAYALLSPDWFGEDQRSPFGLDYPTCVKYLNEYR